MSLFNRQIILGLIILIFVSSISYGQQNLKLWYKQPSGQWEDALPVGNGKLAAMVFGGVTEERIQFNEETLWTGEPRSYAHKGAYQYLGQIRTLLNDGKQKEAEDLAMKEFMSDPIRQMAYQAFGDLYIDFPGHENFTDYKRELDLAEGISRVNYKSNGISYSREVFASYPANAILVKLGSDQSGKLNFSVRMDAIHAFKKVTGKGNQLNLTVKVDKGVLDGVAKVKVITDGKLDQANGIISIQNATTATIVLSAATTFVDYKTVNGKPDEKVTAILKNIPAYEQAKKEHVTDYQKLFSRFKFECRQKKMLSCQQMNAFSNSGQILTILHFLPCTYNMPAIYS